MRDQIAGLAVRTLMIANAPALFGWLHRHDWYGGTLRRWVRQLDLPRGATILEIGCGPGRLSHDLSRLGYRVTGIDRSPAMIRRARRNAKASNDIQFTRANALALPFETESFDAVIAASVLNVVSDKPALVGEMTRVTRTGGVVSALFPTPYFTQENARRHATAKELGILPRAALVVWAARAPKLERDIARRLFEAAGLETHGPAGFLDDMLGSETGRRKAGEKTQRPSCSAESRSPPD